VSDLLRAPLLTELGFRHGFNLRKGGVSEGPYAWSNLGRAVGDDAQKVAENHRRFAAAVGYAPGALYETSQVHDRAVCTIVAGDDVAAVRGREADALCTGLAGTAIGVRVADCVALLLADAQSGAVAAAHAGWRGVVRGVVEAAVDALLLAGGGRVDSLAVAVLPHIEACCFEVGDDVAEALFEISPDPEVIDRSRQKPHVDLRSIVGSKLRELGVQPARIEHVRGCTRCEPERFSSFRRDGQRSGRHVAAIVARS
jgi:purine-nucleoside/S-methyl-5'-thioadenosine phosphorylase / adenosine deaminase